MRVKSGGTPERGQRATDVKERPPDPEPSETPKRREERYEAFTPQTKSPPKSVSKYLPPEPSASKEDFKGVYDDRRVEERKQIDVSPAGIQHAVGDEVFEEEKGDIEIALVNSPPQLQESDTAKPRRGLRAFFKRRQGAKTSSTGPKSISASFSSSSGKTPRITRSIDLDFDPPAGGRASRASRSPGRSRARSLEERRIRNPSIAKKFNRLLRVYDDNDELGYI
jgi:hypothetical protein